MNNAKRLINDFVDEKLQGNLSELPHFNFAQLRGDRKYGARNGGSFDCDNTNLSKAIYLLVFEGVWNNMTPKSLEDGTYRGDTINTFNTDSEGLLQRENLQPSTGLRQTIGCNKELCNSIRHTIQ